MDYEQNPKGVTHRLSLSGVELLTWMRTGRVMNLPAGLRKKDIPLSARVFTKIPGGADWSGMDLNIGPDQESKIHIEWET